MAIQNPPSRLGNPGARAPHAQAAQAGARFGGQLQQAAAPAEDENEDAPPQQQARANKGGGRGRARNADALANLDNHEYTKGPEKLYQHPGEHIVDVERVSEGYAEDSGLPYFGVTGIIVESSSLAAGTPVRDGKTDNPKYPNYFLNFIAERVSAIATALGQPLRPGDVKTADARALTGGPDAGDDAGFDFKANPCRLRYVVTVGPKKDNRGNVVAGTTTKVACYPDQAA